VWLKKLFSLSRLDRTGAVLYSDGLKVKRRRKDDDPSDHITPYAKRWLAACS
jgi:hypothetical protein